MWLPLAVLALFCQSFSWIVQKSILRVKEHDAITYAIYFQVAMALILLPIALVNGFTIPPLKLVWFNLLLMAALYGLANVCSFLSLKYTPVSEFTIILATIPIWTMITSIPILHESTSPLKIIGILGAVAGIFFVFYGNRKIRLHIGHLFALLTAMFFGFAFTNDAILLHHFTATTYSVIYCILPAIFTAIIYPNKLSKVGFLFKRDTIFKFWLGFALFAIAGLAANTSYQVGGEISRIRTVVQLNAILTVILGIFYLKEKENLMRKLIGGIIVILVIILVQLQ